MFGLKKVSVKQITRGFLKRISPKRSPCPRMSTNPVLQGDDKQSDDKDIPVRCA